MLKRIRKWVRNVTGVSTPLGGVSWSNSNSWVSEVPVFRNPIYITYPDNSQLITFLDVNREKIVCINSHLDASVSTKEQHDMVPSKQIDLDLITSGAFNGVSLPLPNREEKLIDICFYFTDDHVLKCSSGGTGIVTVPIHGFFEVTWTLHGGPSSIYHLKELPAPLEARVNVKKRR